MNDETKSRPQLIEELHALRERVARLEGEAAEHPQATVSEAAHEERYRQLVEQLVDGLFVATRDGRYVDVNAAGCQLLGMTRDEVLAAAFADVLMPDEYVRVPATIASFADGQVHRSQWRFRRKDGSVFVGELAGRQLPDGRLQGVVRDITKQKQAEEALQQAHAELEQRVAERTAHLAKVTEELHAIYDGMFDGLLIVDLETLRYVRANAAICRMLGYSETEMLAMSVADLHPQDEVPLALERIRARAAGERRGPIDMRLLRKDGKLLYANLVGNRIVYHERQCVVAFFRDVTDKRLAENALRESEQKYRQLFDNMINGIMVVEVLCDESGNPCDHRFVQANPAFETMTGKSIADLLGKTNKDLPVGWPPDVCQQLYEVAMTGKPIRYERYNETLKRYYDTCVFSPERGRFAHVFNDITERKRVEEALAREHRTLKHLLQSSDHERQLIAYEIHDGLAQHVAGALMQFQTFRAMQTAKPRLAKKAFAAGLTMLHEAHYEARRLIAGVRPPILDESGVVDAVAHLVHERSRLKKPVIKYRSEVSFDRLAPAVENAVYRIVQEGLTNACKHSKSPRVRVSFTQRGDRLRISIRDWGIGFDATSVPQGHFGLEGIRQRTRLLGGRCRIKSSAAKGTAVVVELPIIERTPQ
jgi:PAS domain S-box-containing protein